MSQIVISIQKAAGTFAEDKDIARAIRVDKIMPALDKSSEVILDFSGVDGATQSFIHALISELMRKYGSDVLDSILFKDCNETIQKIITIVTEYMQEV